MLSDAWLRAFLLFYSVNLPKHEGKLLKREELCLVVQTFGCFVSMDIILTSSAVRSH